MKKFLIITIIIFSSVIVHGQNADTFGTCVLATKEYLVGPKYGNAMPDKISFQQKKDSITLESTFPDADGKQTVTHQAIASNGSISTGRSVASKRKYQSSLKWSPDKKDLFITTIFYIPEDDNKIDFTRTETWSFSADGKQLTVDKKSTEARSESWEVKGIYNKQ